MTDAPVEPLGEVIVVGSLNVDLVVRVSELPAPGETVAGGEFARHHGGKGGNQAVAAARMGARVRFIGAVGDDQMGRDALAALVAEGVDTAGVRAVSGAPTGVALIVVDEHGENQIAVASGANVELDRAWVRACLGSQRLTLASVILLGLEVGDEPLLEAASHARSAGATVILDVAPARRCAEELLRSVTILQTDRGEACALTGIRDPTVAAPTLRLRTGASVIVTLGRDGALLADGSGVRSVPGHRVSAVDATGAGDTAAGALAAELASGADLHDALTTAMLAAAISVTVPGARAGMPRRDEVRALGS